MPRKTMRRAHTRLQKMAALGRKSKYSTSTEKQFPNFMYGYLGKEGFKSFKKEFERKKRESEKNE